MKDNRQKYALATRDGAADDILVLVAMVDIEMNHA